MVLYKAHLFKLNYDLNLRLTKVTASCLLGYGRAVDRAWSLAGG